ncbi:MAG: HAD-IA family hydrolase [Candidatus Micrarchaeota archaeon]|nr:HAD-IA family hydrolase [Candidatus Micrarchaeota archaeon]
MITAVIFDLSEVYLTGLLGAEHNLEKILGIKANEMKGLNGPELAAFFHGELTEDEYWLRIIEKNKWKAGAGELKKAVRKSFKEIEGIRKIMEQLKEDGFRLGLLSVHAREWVDYCEKKFGYHELFHSTLYSFEAAASKPDKKVYRMILTKLKSAPEECIFIDDHLENLVPAREMGMKTILFKNAGQLKKDLAALGVAIR